MTLETAPRAPSTIYFGWWILVAAAVAEMLSVGSSSYAYSLFVKPLQEEYGLSRAAANTGQVVLQIGLAAASIVTGRCFDRYPIRRMMMIGSLLMFAGLVTISLSTSLWLMALSLFFLVAGGASAMGPIAAATLVTRWFARRRGLAMGFATAATSLGGIVVPLLMVLFMAQFGWRQALIAHGLVIVIAIMLIAALVIRDRPTEAERAVDPEELATPVALPDDPQAGRWTLWRLVRTANFWLILLSVALLLCVAQAMLLTLVVYAEDGGATRAAGAFLLMVLSVSGIIGKVIVGYAADHVDKRWLVLLAAACTIAFLLILLTGPSYEVLRAACALLGLAIGGTLPVWQAMVADCFGPRSYGTVIGTMNPFMLPFYVGSMYFVGAVFDRYQSYDVAFRTFIGIAILGAVLTLFIRLPGRPHAQSEAVAVPA